LDEVTRVEIQDVSVDLVFRMSADVDRER